MEIYDKRMETSSDHFWRWNYELKTKAKWTSVEDKEALGNSKALNSIFNGVDKNMFILINRCSKAKEA